MSDNITKLISIMQQQGSKNNPPYIAIGVVKSITPFLVQVNDLSLDKDDLYVPTSLLDTSIEGELQINGSLTGNTSSESCGNTSHSHSLGSATITGTFKADIKTQFTQGDLVVLLPLENRQKYVLLNKVVAFE